MKGESSGGLIAFLWRWSNAAKRERISIPSLRRETKCRSTSASRLLLLVSKGKYEMPLGPVMTTKAELWDIRTIHDVFRQGTKGLPWPCLWCRHYSKPTSLLSLLRHRLLDSLDNRRCVTLLNTLSCAVHHVDDIGYIGHVGGAAECRNE